MIIKISKIEYNASRIVQNADKKEAEISYKKIENIEHESDNETYYNCSPGKTQETGVPLQKTDTASAVIHPRKVNRRRRALPLGRGTHGGCKLEYYVCG